MPSDLTKQTYLGELDRFLRHVNNCPDSFCIEWTGCRIGNKNNKKGKYGKFQFRGKPISVHRFSYEVFVGPIPTNYEINHKCRNQICIAPDHLEAVSPEEHDLIDKDLIRMGGRKAGIKRNRSGLPEGVYKRDNKFWVRVTLHDPIRQKHVGVYSTVDEAEESYKKAKKLSIALGERRF